MGRSLRVGLVLGGAAALLLAAAFILDIRAVTALWPYQTYGLSKLFIASLLAAVGAPVLWIGLSGELAALTGGAVNILVTGGGMGGWALWRVANGAPPKVLAFALLCLVLVVATAAMIVFARGLAFRDSRSTPKLVRWSFAGFCVMLLVIGTLLVLRLPGIFPWPLNADASVSYGFAFLGAAAYFAYGVARPVWGNAKGQLLGFLAYDLVLILPFLARLSDVSAEARLSLTLYIAVLTYSGLLAIYFLLLAPGTRLRNATPTSNPA